MATGGRVPVLSASEGPGDHLAGDFVCKDEENLGGRTRKKFLSEKSQMQRAAASLRGISHGRLLRRGMGVEVGDVGRESPGGRLKESPPKKN